MQLQNSSAFPSRAHLQSPLILPQGAPCLPAPLPDVPILRHQLAGHAEVLHSLCSEQYIQVSDIFIHYGAMQIRSLIGMASAGAPSDVLKWAVETLGLPAGPGKIETRSRQVFDAGRASWYPLIHCPQGTCRLVLGGSSNAQGTQAAISCLHGQRVPDNVSAAAPPASWHFTACTCPRNSPHIRSGSWAMTLSNCRVFKDCLHDPARMPAAQKGERKFLMACLVP